MSAQLLNRVSLSFLEVHFDPYLPNEAQKLWLRNAFRNVCWTFLCYHTRIGSWTTRFGSIVGL
jgi:hypothetical protein